MAKITAFKISNEDYIREIDELIDVDNIGCIRACHKLLSISVLNKSESIYIHVVLGKAYYYIEEYSYALLHLKKALIINHRDEEALYFSFLCYIELNDLTAYKETFYLLHYSAKSRELVDKAITIMVQADIDNKSALPSILDSNLALVTEEEKVERAILQADSMINSNKINDGIAALIAACKKFPSNIELLEHIIYAAGAVSKFDVMLDAAEKLWQISPNNPAAHMAGMISANELNLASTITIWYNRILKFKSDSKADYIKLLVGLDAVEMFAEGLNYISSINNCDNNSSIQFAKAVFTYKLGNAAEAVTILKRMSAIFGSRSFVAEAIWAIRNNKDLKVCEYNSINESYLEEHVMNFALMLENITMREFTNNFDQYKDIFVAVVIAGEWQVAAMAIAKLSVAAINKNLSFINDLLVDDVWVSTVTKVNLITAILSKSPKIEFKYSYCGVVHMSDFGLPSFAARSLNTNLNKAFAYAYAVACFNAKDFCISLYEAFKRVHKIVIKKENKYPDYRALGAVISLSAYMYYGGNVTDMIIRFHDCDEVVFKQYLKSINRGGRIYSEDEQDSKFSELLEKFTMELLDVDNSKMFIGKESSDDEDVNEFDFDDEDDDDCDCDCDNMNFGENEHFTLDKLLDAFKNGRDIFKKKTKAKFYTNIFPNLKSDSETGDDDKDK